VLVKIRGVVAGFQALLQRCGWGAEPVDGSKPNNIYKVTVKHSGGKYNEVDKLVG
jgi:hypothetical protein